MKNLVLILSLTIGLSAVSGKSAFACGEPAEGNRSIPKHSDDDRKRLEGDGEKGLEKNLEKPPGKPPEKAKE